MAGAAAIDITPQDAQFLFGYPHVARFSTGVHDRLLSSALYLFDGQTPLLVVANDVIYVSKPTAQRVRWRIQEQTGVPAEHIMVTATHTHSGPVTFDMLSNQSDPVVPKADPHYVARLEDGIVEAATAAWRKARPARAGLALADGSCVGGNRHDPAGPADPEVPVLVLRDRVSGEYVALMLVCSMHPTVLHEDSTLVSGDFPAMTREYLQQHLLGPGTPVLHHTGPCGDQSPRHVARENTFEEARRLGSLLGESVGRAVAAAEYREDVALGCTRRLIDLPRRAMPSVAEAEAGLAQAKARLDNLRRSGAPRGAVRTAECDLFGAEETLCLARAAFEGRLEAAAAAVMPAEIMAARVGPWTFVGWPGEVYVEFGLAVKARRPYTYVISLANGELQGYLVNEEAVRQGRYEALNALFASPASGKLLVEHTLELLAGGSRVGP